MPKKFNFSVWGDISLSKELLQLRFGTFGLEQLVISALVKYWEKRVITRLFFIQYCPKLIFSNAKEIQL